ncbi:MAG: hypothetical protein CSB33_02440 [Desulfobacterales bacterium]|nr:MAG: hypothetical protein CSB33_02440 [Desulfobacterales bacterium]
MRISAGTFMMGSPEVAEDLFYRNVKYIFEKKDVRFTKVLRNLKRKGLVEYRNRRHRFSGHEG